MKAIIIAIVYNEPDWNETRECIVQSGLPYLFVERTPQGVGSLAEAINRGVANVGGFEYAWIITNVSFKKFDAEKLIDCMDATGFAAIHPSFNSDHAHLQLRDYGGVISAPFIEFTCPMVRLDVLKKFPLDECMPYWGHDLDWGHRIRQEGMQVGVHYGIEIKHTYIRNREHLPITAARKQRRKNTDLSTRLILERKYGTDWKQFLKYKG